MFLKPISREDGSPHAFEVRSGYISFRGLIRCISQMPGVCFKEERATFLGQNNQAEFVFKGHEFTVDIPFSDFWVGPKDTQHSYPEIQEVQEYVRCHAISTVRRKIWDVLSFDFQSAFTLRR